MAVSVKKLAPDGASDLRFLPTSGGPRENNGERNSTGNSGHGRWSSSRGEDSTGERDPNPQATDDIPFFRLPTVHIALVVPLDGETAGSITTDDAMDDLSPSELASRNPIGHRVTDPVGVLTANDSQIPGPQPRGHTLSRDNYISGLPAE